MLQLGFKRNPYQGSIRTENSLTADKEIPSFASSSKFCPSKLMNSGPKKARIAREVIGVGISLNC